MTMRAIALLTLATVMAGAVHGQSVERRSAVANDVTVRIWLPVGSLRLIGWDRDSLVVTGTVAAGETFFHGGDSRAMKFGVEEVPAGRQAQRSHLTAYIPRSGRVSVRTSSATIDASDIAGAYSSIGGSIRLTGRAGDVQADAVDGDVSVNMTAAIVRARSGGGAVTVDGSIEDLSAATVSGDLTVTSRDLLKGRLESMTGTIIFLGEFMARGGSVEIDNHAGIVDLRLQGGLPVNLDVTTVAGTITNFMTKTPLTKSGSKMGEVLSVPAGADAPRIVARSFKGQILVRVR